MFLDHCWLFDRHSLNPCIATKLLTHPSPPRSYLVALPCPVDQNIWPQPPVFCHNVFSFLAVKTWRWMGGGRIYNFVLCRGLKVWSPGIEMEAPAAGESCHSGRASTSRLLSSLQPLQVYIHLLPITYLTTALNGWYILTSVYLDPARLTNNQHCGPTQP